MTLDAPATPARGPHTQDPVLDRVRSFWDLDAAGYDRDATHHPTTAAERAAWSAALHRHLPRAPARILDVGAGTGFLTLMAAGLGHRVTALDLSSEMLDRLRAKGSAAGLDVDIVHGAAHEPPAGPFDAIISRHLIWTLPEPRRALSSWLATVPSGGLLLLLEGIWGRADPVEAAHQRIRHAVRRLRRRGHGHHADYDPDLLACLPLAGRSHPETVVAEVAAAGWRTPRLERLADVEWTRRLALPPFDRLLGVTPSFVVIAERA